MKHGPQGLTPHVGVLHTRVGAAFPGSHAVFRGHDLHADLDGIGWFDLSILGITGRRMRPEQLQLMEAIFVGTSYPDARIWNNRVAALAGTTRSTPCLALSGGNAVSEATIYGRRNEFKAMSFLQRVRREMQAGASLDECIARQLKTQRVLPGFGRPLAMRDERIAPIMALARKLGVADGPHVALAFEIERHLQAGRSAQLNVGALGAAFCSDFGLTPREFNLFCFAGFVVGMQPCYLEAADKPPGAVFPTPCSHVQYAGPARRDWPPQS